MKGRYAVIGWGSLIWDLEILTPHVETPWMMEAGPQLPMEFSRISAKRKMGLAVCLDSSMGDPCPTHVIPSTRETLVEAIDDLAARERAPFDRIGGVCLNTDARQGRRHFSDLVANWCEEHGWQGAVWTDLASNFQVLRNLPFSVARATEYLRSLQGESLNEAVRYIANAPGTTNTRLRRALESDPWWLERMAERGYTPKRDSITSLVSQDLPDAGAAPITPEPTNQETL